MEKNIPFQRKRNKSITVCKIDTVFYNVYYFNSGFNRLYSILDIASVAGRVFAVKIVCLDFRKLFFHKSYLFYFDD